MVDLLDFYQQIGMDVFDRLKEFNKVKKPITCSSTRPLFMLATPSFQLEGKNALVVGASSGIGQASAIALAEFGACVTVAARRQSGLLETMDMLNKFPNKHTMKALDITDTDSLSVFIKQSPPFDVLVNAAGLAKHSFSS